MLKPYSYRVLLLVLVLFPLLSLLLLQLNLHGVCDEGAQDAAGLIALNERVLGDRGERN